MLVGYVYYYTLYYSCQHQTAVVVEFPENMATEQQKPWYRTENSCVVYTVPDQFVLLCSF